MNRRYTHDFPTARQPPCEPENLLEGISFVFYARAWARGIAHWTYPGVLSPYWRLLHCTRGAGVVRFGATRHVLTHRNLVLIPADVETSLSSDGNLDMLYAHFLPLLPVSLEGLLMFARPIELSLQEGHRHLIRVLTTAGTRHGPWSTDLLRFRALLDLCFSDIVEPFLDRLRERAPPDARVVHMIEWMQRCYAEPLTNAMIASQVGLGPDQAVRLFAKATGVTPLNRLRRMRIEEASRLLATTDLGIKQIAAACGFANRFHFTRLFAEQTGVGPGAFRRRFRTAAGRNAPEAY